MKQKSRPASYGKRALLFLFAVVVNLSASATDNTVNALSEEPKNNYTYIPAQNAGKPYLSKTALKTNIPYNATGILNLAAEFGLASKWTLEMSVAYNPFILEKGGLNRIAFIQPEVRYWLFQRFEKHFVGLHGIYGGFDMGELSFLTKTFEEHRYKGWGAGAGLAYGYHLPVRGDWALEFTLGVGYVYLKYDKFRCYECDEFIARKNRHYLGPTKASVSLIYMIK